MCCYWLHRDLDLKQVEGLLLKRSGCAELMERRQVAVRLDGVLGERGEVVEQAAEAVDRERVLARGSLRCGLGMNTILSF